MPKRKTKDPLRVDSLPQAGDSVHQQILNIIFKRTLVSLLVISCASGIVLGHWLGWAFRSPVLRTVIPVACFGAVIIALLFAFRDFKRIERNHLGMRGERFVGQLLSTTQSMGYRVYHDIEAVGFNVDHVLIGPGGVFVIETKTISKSIKGNPKVVYDGERVLLDGFAPDRDPIVQARACRDHICKVLTKAVDRRPKMRAVVVYPGWWVEKQPKNAEDWVLNPEMIESYLKNEPLVMKPEDVALYSSALETHIRASYAQS